MNEEGGMQFRGVFVVVVVVVVDEFERGSGLLGGFGRFRPLFGVQFDSFCDYFSSSSNFATKKHYKRQSIHRGPRVFVVFWRVRKGGGE